MKTSSLTNRIGKLLLSRNLNGKALPPHGSDEAPLRSELFSAEQMAQHGKTLAMLHRVSSEWKPDQLLTRLAKNEAVLADVCSLLTKAVKENRRITPAGEWLLDNFYLIEEQIRTAKRHLPKGYSRELPRLTNGKSDGYPRVYDLALATISHGDGRVEPENLNLFVASYQTIAELKLGELWAIPIMLRLALIENLRRVGARIGICMLERDLAGSWADRMMEVAATDPKSLVLVIADMARSNPPMTSVFVSELARRLQGQSSSLALGLTWIEQSLSESGLTIEHMVQSETQMQAAAQVSISNSIGSLRFLSAMDWRQFVESKSAVEQILHEDPQQIYATMDFGTRDQYRHVIEKLAKKSKLSEGLLAREAVKLASQAAEAMGKSDRTAHVGYYLIDDGFSKLESIAAPRQSVIDELKRIAQHNPLLFYLSAIVALTIMLSVYFLLKANGNHPPAIVLSLFGVAVLLASSQLAVSLVNWCSTLLAVSQPLPKMDFSDGIPSNARTLVVVPTMISSNDNIARLAEALEVRFLANRDPQLHFALLTDFLDSNAQTNPQDALLLQTAQSKIEELNQKHKSGSEDIFFLFHRPRKWNQQEGVWMGYERKRGKLSELNSVLRGAAPAEYFSLVVGDIAILTQVKYVITLDTDTDLPRDAARSFVAAMEHPLNRPYFDEKKNMVIAGYGILQPRVGVSLPGTNLSRYAALNGNDPGIDPYTRAVSDVYQDLFKEGSFVGKGIYDVDAFERSLKNRFPENRILSHDLVEGCYARSGLISDVQLYEEYPHTYSADAKRRHRWIRGDWQLAAWLLPTVPEQRAQSAPNDPTTPVSGSSRVRNSLSALSRWKLFDNIRRSLVPPALVLMLVIGWTVLGNAAFWTMMVLALIFTPTIIISMLHFLKKPENLLLSQHLSNTMDSVARHFAQAAFSLACLPYEAFSNLDAITRTLFRMIITHKHLLAWNPSAQLQSERVDLLSSYLRMISAPALALSLSIYLFLFRQQAFMAAAPLLLAWLVSPLLTWWISRPIKPASAQLSTAQELFLRKVARKTWAFFETFVTAEDHWLPPDNFQEEPVEVVAHRTSPTNMGLSLLANLSAFDFGYIQAAELIERTENTLSTMETLERHRGHLYNWYDTRSLKALLPRYISTVDSGNLAGHLLTLNPGLLAIADTSIISARTFAALQDTLGVLIDELDGVRIPELSIFEQELHSALSSESDAGELQTVHDSLNRLLNSACILVASFPDMKNQKAKGWAQALEKQCSTALSELLYLAPWTSMPGLTKGIPELALLDNVPSLRQLADLCKTWPPASDECSNTSSPIEGKQIDALVTMISEASRRARGRLSRIERLCALCIDLASMEYEFLYDRKRCLLSIGFNADERRLDASYYDLLASENRLCNFVAIAQGQLPQESWFSLGRLLTAAAGEPVLFSWSGSMFEYLMPLLVMPTYAHTLLDQTAKAAVHRQIEYGKQRHIPWGISESGYNSVDVSLNYQYRAFGVPGLGLKRGLSQDLVIAPYATALALMVAAEEACLNLERLASEGFLGRYGFFEAIDYTASRLPPGQPYAIIKSFMAHHQGMSFLSLAHLLLGQPMQKRFMDDPSFQATALLLQERIPKANAFHSLIAESSEVRTVAAADAAPLRLFNTAYTATPEIQLLSNGRYHVMVTNAGGGYSRYKEMAITRWREDSTCDNWGSFCYIRDSDSGKFWSNTQQPALKVPEKYEAIFSEARAEFRRLDNDLDTHTEVVVSSEDDIELRRVHITNRSRTKRTIDLTSYAEVVLAAPAHDALHPAFSNLFVQTEIIEARQAIICHRRPRSQDEQILWMFHLMAVHGADSTDTSYETDRLQFIGRGKSLADPAAMHKAGALSGSHGSVLDPIVAIRRSITLEPEQSVTVNIVTGVAANREDCLSLIEKYEDRHLADRVFDLAWTHSQVVLRQLNATESDGQLFARLANSVIYANPLLRADADLLVKNRRGQSGLWGYGISGDLPIVLLQIKDPSNIDLVRQLVQAHAYWRLKGLVVDLVIWNEDRAGYRQMLQEQIMALLSAGVEASLIDKPGGIFVRAAEQMSNEDRILLQSVARAIIKDNLGSLEDQMNRRKLRGIKVPPLIPSPAQRSESPAAQEARSDLILSNGLGGFTPDGREYVITTSTENVTPAPWVNILANQFFGTLISESGLAYTWLENAHEFRLTPWHNDPVTDASGEAFYLRDEDTGYFWSPCPLPTTGANPYTTRHGFGYSVFEHTETGITTELWVYVAPDAPVKFCALKIRNNSGRPRRLSATAVVEWVLGDLGPKTAMHVVTEIDAISAALFANNPYNSEFADRVAFLDVDDTNRTVTGDRTEFIGRNGSLKDPAAMHRTRLSGKVGAGLDPCGAVQVSFELLDGQEREVVFRLGIGQNKEDAVALINRFRGTAARKDVFEQLCQYWKHTLGAVNVQTPDDALNVMANGWLLYQTIACRLWARTGYYQSGGAYGFRDQLQDTMALVHAEPLLLRKQLLLCASRQFIEGDVQHWWHPPSGRGVRTHCSDDYLWLPLATARYVLLTGDTGILDESVHFLSGPLVNPHDDSYFDLPGRSDQTASLYEHCKKAILWGFRYGEHGLPLMGTGDWNDGMNLVGEKGIGESVWLAFFLYEVLRRFQAVARLRGDTAFAERCRLEAKRLHNNIEASAWDGEWYRRAFCDDGSMLGSHQNIECQIDSISQSWAVISSAGDAERCGKAMNALYERLVRKESNLIQLLDPPFDKSDTNPGYIKGYVPGVRENGGQYTHSAIWAVMAFAAMGDSKRTWELLTMINPVNHALTRTAVDIYKVEPYVVAADVYAVQPHTGRGGWTWYTGSAGWMYRLIVESLLGIRLNVDKLSFAPCLPAEWNEFQVHYRYRETVYHIHVLRSAEVNAQELTVDGVLQSEAVIQLSGDNREHRAELRIPIA